MPPQHLDQWDFGPRPPMNIHSIYMGRIGLVEITPESLHQQAIQSGK